MLRTVRLYGVLAKKFGRQFQFEVSSPKEAVAALRATVPGFESHLLENSEPGYHVFSGRENIGLNELDHPTNQVIRIVPAVAGAKKGGVLQIILGVVLLVIGYFIPVLAPYTTPLGLSLIVGGIAQILFAPPSPKNSGERENPNNRPSYSFDGVVNTSQQGNPVPVGYGRLIVGSQVITGGLYVSSI